MLFVLISLYICGVELQGDWWVAIYKERGRKWSHPIFCYGYWFDIWKDWGQTQQFSDSTVSVAGAIRNRSLL